MNSATQSARSAAGSVAEQLRPLGERRRARAAGLRRRGGRAEQRPRPLGVPLPHRRPAPGRVQLAPPVVGHRQRHDLLRRTPAEPPAASVPAAPPPPTGPATRTVRPGPTGGFGTTPSRCMPASHSCGASTAIVARAVAAAVDGHAGRRPRRHPPGERRAGQRGQQLGGRGPDVAAAVGQRLLQERLVRRGQPRAQRVEEHQPVLGPLRRPGRGQQRQRAAAGSRARRAASRATRSANSPSSHSRSHAPPVVLGSGQRGAAARRAAQRELPVRVEPGQPQRRAARRRRAPAGRRSVRARAASSSAGSTRRRGRGSRARWPRPATGAAARSGRAPCPGGRRRRGAGPVGEQHAPAGARPRRGSGGRGSSRRGLRPRRRPARAAARPAAARSARPPRPAARPARPCPARRARRRAPLGAEQRRGDELLPRQAPRCGRGPCAAGRSSRGAGGAGHGSCRSVRAVLGQVEASGSASCGSRPEPRQHSGTASPGPPARP